MKISINWLKEYVQTDSNPVEISKILTNLGLEVEKIEEKMKEITENIVKQIPTLIDKKIDLFSSKVNQKLNGI